MHCFVGKLHCEIVFVQFLSFLSNLLNCIKYEIYLKEGAQTYLECCQIHKIEFLVNICQILNPVGSFSSARHNFIGS